MKYEWKKQEKEFYGAKKSPSLVTVPAQNYIMISGKGVAQQTKVPISRTKTSN